MTQIKKKIAAMVPIEEARRLERRVGETEQSVNNAGRRIDELKDDLELMLKGEITGCCLISKAGSSAKSRKNAMITRAKNTL